MSVHPIEYRYFYPEMKSIFTEEAKLQKWLDVEAALAWAHGKLGTIPIEAASEIERKAKIEFVKLDRVKKLEEETHHDLLAMVKALSEVCDGDAGNYVHLGATSYDIEDTALALQLREAFKVLREDLVKLLDTLLKKADAHKSTICIARTHGQHALPTTYGMKFALWASEVYRHLDRLEETQRRLLVGKMSGAVGTMASFERAGFEVQRLCMERLGLEPDLITNQVVQRDRHAELQCLLALIAGTLDKMAREIRNLQRTEIAEISEPVRSPSSTMPHKRNPNVSERICGISRIIRASVIPALETIALEHERDISNSSVERITIPEGFILTDYILRQMTGIIEGLEFNYENIKRNLEYTFGLCMTEKIMMELVKKRIGRQDAHEALRRVSMKVWSKKKRLEEVILEDETLSKHITLEELREWLNPRNYIGTAVEQVDMVVKKLRDHLQQRK